MLQPNEDFNIHGVRRKPWQEGTNYFAEAYSWPPGADSPCMIMFAWNNITGERYCAKTENIPVPVSVELISDVRETMMKLLRAALTGKEDAVFGAPDSIELPGNLNRQPKIGNA